MTDETSARASLLARVADECAVPLELLEKLALLEVEIPDLNVWGAKAELGRRVTSILDDEAQREQSR